LFSDAYEEDMSGSDAESDSLEGSDEDGFLVDDDGNNMVMIDQMTTNNTHVLSWCILPPYS
jgi:hypothetical protein